MDLRIPELMKAYTRGREAVLIALYRVLVSTLRGYLGDEYPEDQVKSAVANAINRITLRPESRADPRLGDGALARKLRSLCDRQLVKEAAALVMMVDVCAGDIEDLEAANDRLNEAERLAGPDCARVRSRLDPRTADPSDVEAMLMTMAGVLVQIAESNVLNSSQDA